MEEIGGYLPLELVSKSEYYDEEKYQIKKYNSGRSAIIVALLDSQADTIYLPIYLCQSVEDEIKKQGFFIKYYNLDKNFNPIIEKEVENNEIVLWVNYFGMFNKREVEKIINGYKNVIVDNTQAFFTEPINNVYNIYSLRKFFGVSDGAYLAGKKLKDTHDLSFDSSSEASLHLLKVYETSTNDNYRESLANEERISNSGLLKMSKLTERILKSIDYKSVLKKRSSNFRFLNHHLKQLNEFCFLEPTEGLMTYPFLNKNNIEIRKRLLEFNIYVPQWWRAVLENKNANRFECYLSMYLLPLPIDQRYSEKDMEKIIEVITEIVKEG